MSQRPIRRSYLMAMAAGAVIIGGSTFGVTLAQTAQAGVDPVAATTAATAPAATGSVALSSGSITTSSLGSAAPSASAGSSTPAASSSSSSSSSTAAASSGRRGTTSGAPATTVAPTPTSTAPPKPAPAPKPTPAPQPTPAPKPTPAPAPAPAAAQFKDGQYSATASYDSPGGPQKIGVTLTLQSDTVSAATLDLLGDSGIAHTYQGIFQQGYSAEVVGKKIDAIKLGAVGGSSLTSGGFNKALAQIEQQARG